MSTLGETAYRAYGESREWATANGGTMPQWSEQRPELCAAWEIAAQAVAAAIVAAAEAMRPVVVRRELTAVDRARLEALDCQPGRVELLRGAINDSDQLRFAMREERDAALAELAKLRSSITVREDRLSGEVRDLRAEVDRVRGAGEKAIQAGLLLQAGAEMATKQRDEALAEVARLRAWIPLQPHDHAAAADPATLEPKQPIPIDNHVSDRGGVARRHLANCGGTKPDEHVFHPCTCPGG